MDHFVGQHPVLRKLSGSGFVSHANADQPPILSPGLPVPHTVAVERNHAQHDVRNGEVRVVGAHRFSGPLHPAHHVGL